MATRLNPIEKREYAYGSGAPGGLVRKTTHGYLHTGNSTYINLNIVDRVNRVSVLDSTGTLQSETQSEYDNYTEGIQGTSAMNHDGAFGTGYGTRGNVTASKRWRNTDGALLTTRNQYDDVGNVIKSTDPLGHNTTFDYTDAWANAACAPAGQGRLFVRESKNHLNHRAWNTWNSCTGTVASARDENDILAARAGTTYSYDFMDRLDVTNLPDGGQTDNDYDDTNRNVTAKAKKDSSSYVASRAHYDVLGRIWRKEQCEDGPTCAQVIRTDTAFDALGRKETVTNPYRPGVSAPTDGLTKFKFDALGRTTRVIPADGNEGADTNVVKTDYAGNVSTVTDQTGKQRRSFTDALGRLIQVDEPGGGGPATGSAGSATVNSVNANGGVQEYNISAIAAIGSVTLSGTEQSTQSQTQSATQSSGSVTVNGSEQSVQEQTQPATSGTGSINVTGYAQSAYVNEPYWGCVLWDESGGCMEEGWVENWVTVWDYGQVTAGVSGCTKSVNYYSSSSGTTIAADLENAINADANCLVSASSGGSVLYLTSKATGASTNYNIVTWSSSNLGQHFDPPSFVPWASGSTLTGGANAQFGTVYDSGTVTVTVNQGGGQVVATANFGSSSTASTIASDLRATLNASSLLIAGGSGATISLTSEAAGASTNYTLATSWTYNTGKFASPSFTASKSGNNMTGGSDAQYSTVYDSGTVTITVNGVNKQVSYGQGSTTSTIASALATAIYNDLTYPASASANGATVNLTARSAGTVGNGYALAASTTYNSGQFAGPSFSASKSGNFLSGGVAGSIVYDTGTVTLTVATCTPFTVNYANGSTRDTVAAALRSAVNANAPCLITAGGSGTTISLVSDATGSGVNFALSTSGTTNYSQYFGSPSFSLATSGMTGGANYTPGTLATPVITAYTYDTLDNPTCVEQRGNVSGTGCASAPANDATSPWRVRRFTYNSLSQLLGAKNPESGTTSFVYDNDGNLLAKTAPAPNQLSEVTTTTINYGYDPLHRLQTKDYSNTATSPDVMYSYDQTSHNGLNILNGIGHRTGMNDGSGVTAWSYEITPSIGWKTIERRTLNGATKTLSYQNNLAGTRTSLSYPGGATTVSYGLDAAGRTTSATSGSATYAESATYAPHGALSTINNGGLFGGVESTYFYNNRLQPCRISVRTSGAAPGDCNSTTLGTVLDFRYTFDNDPGTGVANNGNVSNIENLLNTNRTQSFTYDELNRILTAKTQATSGPHAWGYSFAYDPWANLKPATVTQGSAPPLGALPALDNRILGFCYDAVGNLLIEGACGGMTNLTYTYDAENRIVTTAGVNYSYDGDGKRVKKDQISGSTFDRLYWTGTGSDPLAESDLAGVIIEEYVFFGGKRIARRVVGTGGVFYYFTDHLGTSRAILQAGQTAPCYDADSYPFGGERVVTDTCPQNHKFTGRERDAESGLDYFGARFFKASNGRFHSPDPVGIQSTPLPQTLNRYTYTMNNPLRFVDPDGKCSAPAGLGPGRVGICIGAFIAAARIGEGSLGKVGYGDNRTFTGNDKKATSRVQIQLVVTPATGAVTQTVTAESSCAVVPVYCVMGRHGSTPISSGRDPKTGQTHIRVVAYGENGFMFTPGGPQGVIQMDIQLTVSAEGVVTVDEGSMSTGYPSFEIYSYTPEVQPLVLQKENKIEDLKLPMRPMTTLWTTLMYWGPPAQPRRRNPEEEPRPKEQ